MHMATQRTRALTEATTAAQGALAWHGTGLPACGLSARFLDLNTHICSEVAGVSGGSHSSGRKAFPSPTLPGKVGLGAGGGRGWQALLLSLAKLPFLGFVSCRPARLATQRANRTFERLSAPACCRPHTGKVLL